MSAELPFEKLVHSTLCRGLGLVSAVYGLQKQNFSQFRNSHETDNSWKSVEPFRVYAVACCGSTGTHTVSSVGAS